ncbi:MAG: hypothetical protein DWQ02_06460 [Bacteroidetes bacterium]|nr:MAG: hypothetical protein DWQ02_06460 [Bacteroidota bacterium]
MIIKTYLKRVGHNMYLIPIPGKQGEQILKEFGKRVICKGNGGKIHCAVQKSKTHGFYIGAGKDARKKLKIQSEGELVLTIQEDNSKYQLEVPEELSEVLETDPEASERFEALTDGKKRSLIHYVGKAKQSMTRINRALKIAENLKFGFTDLKELMS